MKVALAIGVIGCLVGGGMLPVVAETPERSPAAQLDVLKYFEGTWTCQIKPVKPSDPSKASEVSITRTLKRDLNRFWYLGDSLHSQTRQKIHHEILGYNTVTQQFGRTIITDDGGFANLLSTGWKINQWIWEGSQVQMRDKTREPMRIVIAKTSDRAFESVTYRQTPQQEWQPIQQEMCKK